MLTGVDAFFLLPGLFFELLRSFVTEHFNAFPQRVFQILRYTVGMFVGAFIQRVMQAGGAPARLISPQ